MTIRDLLHARWARTVKIPAEAVFEPDPRLMERLERARERLGNAALLARGKWPEKDDSRPAKVVPLRPDPRDANASIFLRPQAK